MQGVRIGDTKNVPPLCGDTRSRHWVSLIMLIMGLLLACASTQGVDYNKDF
jgi:hypothetical protein